MCCRCCAFAASYDYKFKEALDGLANRASEAVRPADRQPDDATTCCREIFKTDLEL